MTIVDIIVAQNTAGHANYLARPFSVPPNWNWYNGRGNMGNPVRPADCSAVAGWGQVFPIQGKQAAPFGLFEVSAHRVFAHVRNTTTWREVQKVGNGFKEEAGAFIFPANSPAALSIVQQPTIGGAHISLPKLGTTSHWWPGPRGAVASDTDWIYNEVTLRVLDTRDAGKFCAQIGADWWKNASIGYGAGGNNPVAGHGNWLALTTSPQLLGFYSCDEAQFRANVPAHLKVVTQPPVEPVPELDSYRVTLDGQAPFVLTGKFDKL